MCDICNTGQGCPLAIAVDDVYSFWHINAVTPDHFIQFYVARCQPPPVFAISLWHKDICLGTFCSQTGKMQHFFEEHYEEPLLVLSNTLSYILSNFTYHELNDHNVWVESE